ncbi:MAG: ClC family H(+)/Cl(-) exchange transporter, partial [Gluconobacter japonicus]
MRTALAFNALHPFPAGLMMIALGSITAFIAAWMARRLAPLASGSGIPHVEAVLAGLATPASVGLIPVKFIGGL